MWFKILLNQCIDLHVFYWGCEADCSQLLDIEVRYWNLKTVGIGALLIVDNPILILYDAT